MNAIKRMQFAHARGARIQVPEGACRMGADPNAGRWVTIGHPYWSAQQSFRIHPDDEHMQYGPLSRSIRESALDDMSGVYFTASHQAAMAFVRALAPGLLALSIEDGELLSFFKLFAAEFLADEGL